MVIASGVLDDVIDATIAAGSLDEVVETKIAPSQGDVPVISSTETSWLEMERKSW